MPLPFNSLRAVARGACMPSSRIWRRSTRSSPAGVDGITRRWRDARSRPKSAPLTSPVADFYLTNPIARASAIMAECSQLQAGLKQAAE